MLAWQPEWFGANRESHIMWTTLVVREVYSCKGRIRYSTFDAPIGTDDILHLAFVPRAVLAERRPLPLLGKLSENGYLLRPLSNGDCLVTIRHDNCCEVLVGGVDPQQAVEDDRLEYEGAWTEEAVSEASGGKLHVADPAGAAVSFQFEGNQQVRVIGRADP